MSYDRHEEEESMFVTHNIPLSYDQAKIEKWFMEETQTSSQCRGMSDNVYFYISPYGEVQPCCFMPLRFGNIREEPLKDILDRMWSHEMFDMDWVRKECPMLNDEFRKKYIDTIPKDWKLPFRIE